MHRISFVALTVATVAFVATTASAGALAVHLDAAQISDAPADGADVVNWDDLATGYWGTNNAVQVYGIDPGPPETFNLSVSPTFVATAINGLPGVRFAPGSNSGLCMDDFLNTPVNGHVGTPQTDDWVPFTGGGTGIAVLYSEGGNGNVWDFSNYESSSHYNYQNQKIYEGFGNTNRPLVATAAWDSLLLPTIYIVNVQADGTMTVYINGTPTYSAVTPGAPSWNINPSIGSRNTSQGASGSYDQFANTLGGVISEVQIFEGDMTLAELEVVNAALGAKYNITTAQIPEPATMSLLALGGLAALIRRRR